VSGGFQAFFRYETVRGGKTFPVARWCQNGANGTTLDVIFSAPKNDIEALTTLFLAEAVG